MTPAPSEVHCRWTDQDGVEHYGIVQWTRGRDGGWTYGTCSACNARPRKRGTKR